MKHPITEIYDCIGQKTTFLYRVDRAIEVETPGFKPLSKRKLAYYKNIAKKEFLKCVKSDLGIRG